MLAIKELPPPSKVERVTPYQRVDRGWIHLDKSRNFACLKLSTTELDAQRLTKALFQAFVLSRGYERFGVKREDLEPPVAPKGTVNVGPHVSLFQYKERPNWDTLEKFAGTCIKIDRIKPHDVIFTSKTLTASNMFLIGIESKELDQLREVVGLSYEGRSEEMIVSWRPHISVAIVPLSKTPYKVPSPPLKSPYQSLFAQTASWARRRYTAIWHYLQTQFPNCRASQQKRRELQGSSPAQS